MTSDAPVGLIPAAGFGRRLGLASGSKEVVEVQGRPLISYLLERFARGGIDRAFLVTRPEKTDIAGTLGGGGGWGVELDYLYTGATRSAVETLDKAYDHVRRRNVALGYPDVIFRPVDAFAHLGEALGATGADVVLGLFPTAQPERSDMVVLDDAGNVVRFEIKQPDQGLRFTWSIAVWTPRFTEYLHAFVADPPDADTELYVGDVIQAAMADGLLVRAVPFPEGCSTDLGTPETPAEPSR